MDTFSRVIFTNMFALALAGLMAGPVLPTLGWLGLALVLTAGHGAGYAEKIQTFLLKDHLVGGSFASSTSKRFCGIL